MAATNKASSARPEGTYQVMVRVDEGVHERLKEISADEERTVSQTVRLAIRKFLENRDDQLAATA